MRWLLILVAGLWLAAVAVQAADPTLAEGLETAVGLPPRQACEALAQLQARAHAEGQDAPLQARLERALQRYEIDREATIPAQLAKRRELQLSIPPHVTPTVKNVQTWSSGYVSPDGNLVLDSQPASLDLAGRSGVRLVAMPSLPDEVLKTMPIRFSALHQHPAFGKPAWSPNGLAVAYSYDGVMCVATIDGKIKSVSHVPDLLGAREGPEGLWDDQPVWSPTSLALVYTRSMRDRQGRILEPRVVWTDLQHREETLSSGQALGFVPVAGSGERILMLGGDSLYLSDPLQQPGTRRVASGVKAAAASPDGTLLCVVHDGRLGFVPLGSGSGSERTVAVPSAAGVVAQPPVWLSPVQVAFCCRRMEGNTRLYSIWLCDIRDEEVSRLADGYLQPWAHNSQQVATSNGLLQLDYGSGQ